jgi:hypothetical protein
VCDWITVAVLVWDCRDFVRERRKWKRREEKNGKRGLNLKPRTSLNDVGNYDDISSNFSSTSKLPFP